MTSAADDGGRSPHRPSDATLLAAAREGWGVSLRFAFLFVVCAMAPLAVVLVVML